MATKTRSKKLLKPSIKTDAIHPGDYMRYSLLSACEDCAHFSTGLESCSLGYNAKNHRRQTQLSSYELRGKIAFCRFIEIF